MNDRGEAVLAMVVASVGLAVTIHQCEQVLDLFRRRAALHNNRHAQARAACVARLLRWIERRVEQEAAGT